MKQPDKQALLEWEEFVDNIRNSTPIDRSETQEQKAKRIKTLEADPEAWFKYYFPKYCFADPAPFHLKSTKKFLSATHLYQVRAWVRGLSKSTRRMFEIFYLAFAKKFPVNMLLLSKSKDNAILLLRPYKANLECNQRLINDYGQQQGHGLWTETEFVTVGKKSFRAVGREQSPRGNKNEEVRPNIVLFDDIDDDELCRNTDRVDDVWNWIEQAVIPTVEISRTYYILFDNNIIDEDTCTTRAMKFANDSEVIPLEDEAGNSTWPEKNTIDIIERMKGNLSSTSYEKEYKANAERQGKVFKEMTWGVVPPLREFKFLVSYADPATSNKDKPALRTKANNSCKAVVLLGKKDLKYYIINCFVDNATNSVFTDWLYQIEKQATGTRAQFYSYIENNTLQDPFYQQVFLPLFYAKGKETGNMLNIIPDAREKPEKFIRIDGTLEPLNRLGLLIFNIAEKDNPHMKRLESQFKSVSPNSKTMDGPDAVEGGVKKIQEKEALLSPDQMKHVPRSKYSKRF